MLSQHGGNLLPSALPWLYAPEMCMILTLPQDTFPPRT